MGHDSVESLAAACLAARLPRHQAFARLAEHGSARAALAAGERDVDSQIAALGEQCVAQQLQVVSYSQPAFPEQLRQIPDPPLALFVKGEPAWLAIPSIAVVGARREIVPSAPRV